MTDLKGKSGGPAPNPFEKASPISKLLFFWIFPLFSKGYRRKLEESDLYPVCGQDESGHLGNRLEGFWKMELEGGKVSGRKPSLLRALIKMSWKSYGVATAVVIFSQCVFVVAQPILLRLLILTFTRGEADDADRSWKCYVYAGAICLTALLHTLITQPAFYEIFRMSMKMRVAASSLIYRKSLRLSKAAERETNTGQIINLLSNDCARFDTCFMFLPYPFVAPVQTAILSYLMFEQIGVASFIGVAFVLALIPMQYYLAKYSAAFRLQIAKWTDERGRFMNEIIVGMRIIKQYALERSFSNLIDGIRKKEVQKIEKAGLLRGVQQAFFRFTQKLVPYLALLVFFLIGAEPMTADKVFFTLTCLYIMIQVTGQFAPQAVAGIGEFTVSVQRIQDFLLMEEQMTNTKGVKSKNRGHCISPSDIICNNNEKPTTKVTMTNACASWKDDERPTLDKVTFSVDGDTLVMVVGPVGSSKSSLLHAIIDELPLSSGNLSVNGSVSYASQEPWIFGGNLRQNILFGLPYEEGHYKKTLAVCALEEDLKQLPYGDLTVVGERGVALSGGQKARVNLARALYRKSDIYLLDDPLSAVDTRVSRHLFEKCVKKHLSGTLRILVTHQLQYLPQADVIIVLDQGRVLVHGTFEELTDSNFDFKGLLGANNETAREESVIKTNQETDPSSSFSMQVTAEETKPEEHNEKNVDGSVTARTYRDYFTAGHSDLSFASLLFVFFFCQFLTSASDYLLALWTNSEEACTFFVNNNTTTTSQLVAYHDDRNCKEAYLGENTYLFIYTGLIFGVILFNIIRSVWFYLYCAKISVNLHDKMFQSVVRAPVKFFDDNPSGRIMNRFTMDIGTIDEMLPQAIILTLIVLLYIFGVICVVILSNYYMAVPTLFFFVVAYFLRRVFVRTSRDIKRIEATARSPVFTHVAASIQGLTTIRAFNSENVLIRQFDAHHDVHSSSWFLFISVNRCFGIWLELICDIFLILVTFSFFFVSSSDQGGNVGLAISSMLTLMNVIQWGMFQSAETENFMTSVERALEYSKLKPEADLDSKRDSRPSQDWPSQGQIEINNLTLSYKEGQPVLKDLSFKITPSEKIGIIGRTGAGKSSIIAALFRLTEPQGDILIDNVPVKQVGLHDLRKSISVITQDAVLFSGSVRYNLDPFDNYKDDHLWRVVEEVELKDAIPSLDYRVEDGGANFSVGQRQLMCLARAILRKNKILVMDEATANVDPRTDNLIQQTIRSKFSDCTIITIAHRLHSIIDCDRILVLDHGHLKQYDHPHILLQDSTGIFSRMVAQTGHGTNVFLKKMAFDSFKQRGDI